MNFFHKKNTNDSQLLERLRSGEEKAVAQWYREYEKKLLRFVLQKVSNKQDAEEIAHDTFLNCLKHLPLFRGEASIWTWMRRIASHEVADYYRKKYAKRVLQTTPLLDFLFHIEITDASATSQKVKSVFAKMRADYVELLKLKYIDKRKVKDIARELKRSVKSIESDLFRARGEFKTLYLSTA